MDYNTDLLRKGRLRVLQLLNCEISSLISSIISVLQGILQTGLVAHYWGCLTLPITRLCFQLLRALPNFNHLDLNSSCWVSASGWIILENVSQNQKNAYKFWQLLCEQFCCPLYFAGRAWHLANRLTFVSRMKMHWKSIWKLTESQTC